MKRIFFVLAFFAFSVLSLHAQSRFNYAAQWKTIEKMLSDGLPESALPEIEKVHQAALRDEAYGQLTRAVTTRYTCFLQTEENPHISFIRYLKEELTNIPYPAKSVMYSLLAESYLNYYHANRWRIYDRTELADKENDDDIDTWDAPRLISTIIRYYRLSLDRTEELQSTSIDSFKEALEGDASIRYLRPVLYDFLAHRAIDAFLQDDWDLTEGVRIFPIDRVEYFGDAETFASMRMPHGDTLSTGYQVMKLFRELTSFRLRQGQVDALVDVNLKRFNYVKRNGTYADPGLLYEKAMEYQVTSCEGEKIWGKAAYALACHYKTEGERWCYGKNPEQRRMIVKAVELCREIQKKAVCPEDRKYAEKLIEDATSAYIALQLEKNNLPDKPALASVSYRNQNTLYINVYRCTDKDIETLERSTVHAAEVKNLLAGLPRKAQQQIELPVWDDYQTHYVDIKIDSLPAGTYLIVATDKPNPIRDKLKVFSYNPVRMTEIRLLQRMSALGNVEAYVVHAASGKPLQGATVDVLRTQYNRQESRYVERLICTTRTDTCGMAGIPFDRDHNPWLRITYGDDTLVELLSYSYDSYKQEKKIRTVLFTDRAIYRPGQTVYFKGLVYESDEDGENRIITGRKASVSILDANGKEIARQELTGNEYGTFNGTFTIPQGLLNGEMQMLAENGSAGFRVEEYRRPTFEAKIFPAAGNYRLGDTVVLTGEAKALSGYFIDGAMVQYRVVRHAEYRPLKRQYIYPPVNEPRQIAFGKIQTDSEGRFAIAFKAEDSDLKSSGLIYTYELTADVTDLNGETQQATQAVKISKTPILIQTGIPDKITANDTSRLKYGISAANLSGTPISADVQVTLFSLKGPGRTIRNRLDPENRPDTAVMSREEFKRYFPYDAYRNEADPGTYPRERQIAFWDLNTREQADIDLGVLKNASAGWYLIRLKATSGAYSVTDSICIHFRRDNDPVANMDEWITTVKNSGEPGDTAVFFVAGGADESHIRYDVLFKDRMIERKWISVDTIPRELRFPITETYRGGFAVQFAMVHENRTYTSLREVHVPYGNKQLDIAFTTFREQLLPGEKEKWTLTVKGPEDVPEAAEMVATLYDASIDAFVPHRWVGRSFFYPARSHRKYSWDYSSAWWGYYFASPRNLIEPAYFTSGYLMSYDRLMGAGRDVRFKAASRKMELDIVSDEAVMEEAAVRQNAPPLPEASGIAYGTISGDTDFDRFKAEREMPALAAFPLRSNFNETAFFYPELRAGEDGKIRVEFIIPEALTRWNMLGFAHTRDFKTGSVANRLVTQKQVAVNANFPRFFRQGDTLVISAKVDNLTGTDLKGNALLRLYDAFTMQPVDASMLQTESIRGFSVKAGQSAGVQWKLAIPENIQAVTCRLTAQAGNHTDGEERSVPVLSNRMLVTESMPFMVRGERQEDFRFEKLSAQQSSTLKNHRLTLEYSSNPAWYAVQALPYLMEYPYECAEQTFARFYANALASAVIGSSPRIRQIFDRWKSIPDNKSLISNLEKNQELKQALLEETPWVVQASNETERKKRLGLLFDLNRMDGEQKRAWDKLLAAQGSNGAFPWFAGQPEDRFVTQHIVIGLERLSRLRALSLHEETAAMIQKALSYCDIRMDEDYRNALKARSAGQNISRPQIGPIQLHYLYMCSFSRHRPADDRKAFDFYLNQAERYWAQFDLYEQAMTVLIMHRFGKTDVAQTILRSLKERARKTDSTGMYWVSNRRGYFWNQAPIETQVLMIEAFYEAGSDSHAIEEMKIWLLRNKQTNGWKTTKATTDAVYALLMTGDEWLENSKPLDIRIGGKPLGKAAKESLRPEAGTGYAAVLWNGKEINSGLASLRIANPNSGIAWGAVYWQYFEQLDRITPSETNLKINKQLYIKQNTENGRQLIPLNDGNHVCVGDLITVRLELRADRDFEYVHLKDMRAAGFEPVNALSGYRNRGGLGYYESIKDAAVNFFIGALPQGTYVFEYDLRVTHAGAFSNGITTIQCMYAPEFSAHSEGIQVIVETR